MKLALFTILILTSAFSFAANYSGKIIKTPEFLYFEDSQDNKKYVLHSSTPLIAIYVNKLSDGDFISFDGFKSSKDQSVTINSFNYVGLKDLIGTWVGDDNYCYIFHSFTEFSISRQIGKNCQTPHRPNYTYVLSPTASTWVIIISSGSSGSYSGNYLGDLKFYTPNEAGFYLYDPETGDILRSVRLRK